MLEAVVEFQALEGPMPGDGAVFVLPAGCPAKTAEALAEALRGAEIVPEDAGLAPLAVGCPWDGAAQSLRHGVRDIRIVPAGAGPASCMQALCLAETFEEFAAAALLAQKGLRPRGRGWVRPSAAETAACAAEALRRQAVRTRRN